VSGTLDSAAWADLLAGIAAEGKDVALDLSTWTMNGTEFDPGTANTGEKYIVSLVLPDAATGIKGGNSPTSTFRYFTNLKSVAGEKVTNIGNYAFIYCTSLTQVSFPEAVTIGTSAFQGCTGLTGASLPRATGIGNYAFIYCTGLTTASFPKVTSVGYEAFQGCTGLTSISLPEVTGIGGRVFKNCTGLTTVNFPKVTSIRSEVFYGCTGLTGVSIPEVTSIGSYAFAGCTGLTDADLPETISIDSYAFAGCTGLTGISIPEAISIGSYAFAGCTGLTGISIPASLTSISHLAFAANLTSFTVAADNPNYSASLDHEMLLNKTGTTLVMYPSASGQVTSLITAVGSYAFAGCTGPTAVDLPPATSIGSYAFAGCTGLTAVDLPAAASIGSYAFAYTDSTALIVTLGSTAPTLEINLFNNVTANKTVTVKRPTSADSQYGAAPADTTVQNWGNAFRGKGWDGTSYLTGTVNGYITLAIEDTPP
jgi:hypothetical protein